MDPGTILSVVELSTSVLKLGYKVHAEFFGRDKSVDKLKQLNDRLRDLHDFLQEILEDTKRNGPALTEPFKGKRTLERTLEDCKEFLNQFEKALSESGTFQRIKFIIGQSENRLDAFHKRIDQHYIEIHAWSSRAIDKKVRLLIERNSISLPTVPINTTPTAAPITYDRSPELGPYRSLTGDTLLADNYANVVQTSPRAPRSPNLHPSRTPSLASISEDSERSSPEIKLRRVSRQSFDHGGYGVSPGKSFTPVADYLTRGHTTAPVLGRSSYTSSIAGSIEESSSTSPPAPQTLTPFTVGDPASPVPLNDGRRVVLALGAKTWTFSPVSYTILDVDGNRIVEWVNQTTKIVHYIPDSISKIPHTKPRAKPTDKICELSFLPPGMQHVFEVTENGVCVEIRERPRYHFNHKPDREAFQRKFRGCQYLEMIQAKVISEGSRLVAKDVHLKVWSRGESDEEPTMSFAQHGAKEINHQVEYKIRWFKKTPEMKDSTKLVLRTYSLESDLDYGILPEEPNPKRFGIMRRLSGSSSKSRSPSINGVLQPLYDPNTKGITPPRAVQELRYLEIEFQSPRLRDTFLNACYEAHHGSKLSRRSTAISDGLPSPLLDSRPGRLSLPFSERTAMSETLLGMHESPIFTTPRYTPSDLMPEFPRLPAPSLAFTEEPNATAHDHGTTTHRDSVHH